LKEFFFIARDNSKKISSSLSNKTLEKINAMKFEEFLQLDIRVGEVKSAEKIEKSQNLMKLEVDIGDPKPRQIVAGVANDYSPQEMIGKKIIVLANLKPKKLMGIESQGMVLAADMENHPILLKLDEKYIDKIKPGTKIK
jgi:methionyl-tRNA synthetase